MAETTTLNAGFKKYDDGDNAADGFNWNEGYNDNWDLLDAMNGAGLDWDGGSPPKLAIQVDDTTTAISGDDVVVKDPLTIGSIIFTPKTSAPGSPSQGQVCLADRANWDPVSKGSGGPYFVWYNGSAWVSIDSQ